jgi:hypothetical protein
MLALYYKITKAFFENYGDIEIPDFSQLYK